MKAFNLLAAGDLARAVQATQRDLDKMVRETTGADSEPVIAAAKVLKDTWRAQLATSGGDDRPAPPGSPPHKQTGILRRSIGSRVVNGFRRVGSGAFIARLQEFGWTAKDDTPVAPRPHGRVAFEQSKDRMTDVLVSEAQQRIARGKA